MSQNERIPKRFLGSFFDPDSVMKIARWAVIISWVVVAVYAVDFVLAILVFGLQYARGFMSGMGPSDLLTQIVYLLERPFRGAVYFIVLQAIGGVLLILMDMESDLRQAGGK